jgi:hypothetical protein
MMLERTCPSCKKTTELSEEYYNKVDSIPNAFEYYCKKCMKKINEFIASKIDE